MSLEKLAGTGSQEVFIPKSVGSIIVGHREVFEGLRRIMAGRLWKTIRE